MEEEMGVEVGWGQGFEMLFLCVFVGERRRHMAGWESKV